jgi:dephospho-CoA kinase
MRVIGLTGQIGAGKSTVAGWLAGLGAVAIDSDVLVRELYAHDATLQARLEERFGPGVVAAGTVDRTALADAVFDNPAALADLEALVHPAVFRLRDQQVAAARATGAPAVVFEAIKLVEAGGSAQCDELWIVVADAPVQRARLAERGLSEAEARRRLAAQGSVATWCERFIAESARLGRRRPVVVFDNSGGVADGQAQVARLWRGIEGG